VRGKRLGSDLRNVVHPTEGVRGSFKTTVNGRSMHRGAAGPSEFVVFSKGGDSAQVQKEQPVGF
jgi:hypothetical protein